MMNNKIFITASTPQDWKNLLAQPCKHWQKEHSAKALAYCWLESDGLPKEIIAVFEKSNIKLFQDIKLLVGFPEYKVFLPPFSGHPSQNDIFILAKSNGQLISIMVEGKVSESFGETIETWLKNSSKGKEERLDFLYNQLNIDSKKVNPSIRYQLLHRTVSALIEAKRFNAANALMLVHSFSNDDKWFNDYNQFLGLLELKGEINSLIGPKKIKEVNLYFAWVRGNSMWLSK